MDANRLDFAHTDAPIRSSHRVMTAQPTLVASPAFPLRRYLVLALPFVVLVSMLIGFGITTLFPEILLSKSLTMSFSIGLTMSMAQLGMRWVLYRWGGERVWLMLFGYIVATLLGIIIGKMIGEALCGGPVRGLVSDRRYNSITLVFSLVGAVASTLYVTGIWLLKVRSERAERAEKAAAIAQLRNLQSQVEPHFLFNTLATLDALMQSDVPRARQMLAHLIAYLRHSLSHARSAEARLGDEFALLSTYLEIMSVRLQTRIHTRLVLAPAFADLPFPPMLLQPLVENAIRHGIEPSRSGGELSVEVGSTAGMLWITVADTGVGLGQSPYTGTGSGSSLTNIRERLVALFGPSASLDLQPGEQTGTCATLRIPLAQLQSLRLPTN